ncbi:unnamed protein product [Durusdinium trenchii]|uniref:Uncharacterized protein n=2 Tax=Durusdinium trenchii TaxID=1381693 RepID=A0ABP0NZ67_9DINO
MAPLPELVEKPTKATANKVRVGKGKPLPYGCSQAAKGLNFSILAPDSLVAWLVVEVPSGQENTVTFPDVQGSFLRFELQAPVNRTGNTWHIQIVAPFSLEGLRYGWHIDPEVSYDNQPLLEQPVLDPCARCLTSGGVEVWNKRGENIKYAPLSVVPDFRALDCFDWQGVTSPGYALQDLIIYEAHVRSFTKNKDSGVKAPGTFLGFIEKIPHLLNLGINCVELLPIFEFDESQVPWKHPKTGEHLCQYWGYQTCSYNTPMQRFAVGSTKNPWAAIVEFKTLVRELHRNGIEVVLDVVFNHTGEGAWGVSNWNCLAKVAVNHYYLMSNGYHTNYTGCGNTLHANNPNCTEWIIDCLRYWALDMHVDGFRFDLASSLTRGSDGQCMPEPPFIRRLVSDPCLQHVKLIAEPWDCAWPDGYLVGQFPSGDGNPRWAEWNGKFRDAVRGFIKGDPNMKGEFATRVCGSADLYEPDGRGPCHSINFITAHDGFTLRDLVSYNKKHNHLNNEESGEDNNISWNCGEENDEGPSKKKDIMKLRDQQMRNMILALFLSAGTPMVTSGDEYGRSQGGNNNTWCQDELNWFSWADCAKESEGLVRFFRLALGLRKQHRDLLERTTFLTHETIQWNHDDWESDYNFISYILHRGGAETGEGSEGGEVAEAASECGQAGSSRDSTAAATTTEKQRTCALLVAFNAGHVAHDCRLPAGREWFRIVDSSLPSPQDICECDEDAQVITGESYVMSPYSCIVLRSFDDLAESQQYDTALLPGSRLQQLQSQLRQVASQPFQAQLAEEDFEEIHPSLRGGPEPELMSKLGQGGYHHHPVIGA